MSDHLSEADAERAEMRTVLRRLAQSRSPAKAAAVRVNGRLGGRPPLDAAGRAAWEELRAANRLVHDLARIHAALVELGGRLGALPYTAERAALGRRLTRALRVLTPEAAARPGKGGASPAAGALDVPYQPSAPGTPTVVTLANGTEIVFGPAGAPEGPA